MSAIFESTPFEFANGMNDEMTDDLSAFNVLAGNICAGFRFCLCFA